MNYIITCVQEVLITDWQCDSKRSLKTGASLQPWHLTGEWSCISDTKLFVDQSCERLLFWCWQVMLNAAPTSRVRVWNALVCYFQSRYVKDKVVKIIFRLFFCKHGHHMGLYLAPWLERPVLFLSPHTAVKLNSSKAGNYKLKMKRWHKNLQL